MDFFNFFEDKLNCIIIYMIVMIVFGVLSFRHDMSEYIREDKLKEWQQYKLENDCKLKQIDYNNNTNKWFCNKSQVEVINDYLE